MPRQLLNCHFNKQCNKCQQQAVSNVNTQSLKSEHEEKFSEVKSRKSEMFARRRGRIKVRLDESIARNEKKFVLQFECGFPFPTYCNLSEILKIL